MKIICNIETGNKLTDFFKIVDGCHGSVKLILSEVSQYNLKSYISRYKALAKLDNVSNFQVELSDPEDLKKLKNFIQNNQERN